MVDLKEIHWLMWQVLDKSQTRSIDSHSVQPKKKLKVETKKIRRINAFPFHPRPNSVGMARDPILIDKCTKMRRLGQGIPTHGTSSRSSEMRMGSG